MSSKPTTVAELLNAIELGSPVAEFDAALSRYFVETSTFQKLVDDGGDIVSGDKGAGKTALFRILKDNFGTYDALGDVEVISAFNPQGTPAFQQLTEQEVLSEGSYISVWKSYLFMLAGNWLLDLYGSARPGSLVRLDDLLQNSGLRAGSAKPASAFQRVISFIRPKQAEVTGTVTPDGIPIFTTKISLADNAPPKEVPVDVVRYDEALSLLDDCLDETGVTLWLVFDRLDEAFQASPEVEKPALRALLRSYLDIQSLAHLQIKLFLRNDLFARISEGGFVNLTHINARKIPITWEDDDLYTLLYRRLRESKQLLEGLGLPQDAGAQELFDAVFPSKVDEGSKRPTTWNWILTRIRDGNDVKSPRNLVDLVIKAIDAQKRREAQDPRSWVEGDPLLTGDSLKRALTELSRERVTDTLLAEAGDAAAHVKRFEGGKAEQNAASLQSLFGKESTEVTKRLVTLGFLEKTGQSYKVPMLYRQGLDITQGKAWAIGEAAADDDES
ncbi:P-loop ATPase, Sll1717 family [Curtobacterium sp. MCPF17_051]|uniref:P-loop ATPase, Sll1717 family n=1 Tax=Curtobacterium sp. MCPF17_051 TaxID=2175640 RepID=UPI0011B7CFBE|nr:hypothetical protein [Curtobacterium sp. MCPF17_051]